MAATKWVATAASILIQSSTGGSYAFGIYSPLLKSTQGYDQSILDSVSVFKDIGANAGVLSGVLYSAVCRSSSSHSPTYSFWGPWFVHAVGAIQGFAGYFFLWLAVTGAIPRPRVEVVCLFMFLAAHAQTFFNTANVVTAVRNFPEYSGTVVGIMKGFLGLSGAVLIEVYDTLFAGKPSSFLLMLASVPTLLSLALMFLVKIHENNTPDRNHDRNYLNSFSLISITVASYIMVLIILKKLFGLSQWMREIALALLLLQLCSPLGVAVKTSRQQNLSQKLKTPLLVDDDDENHQVQQVNLLQAMRSLNFWLLFIAMLCGMGSGLATINNITQIGESIDYTPTQCSTLVSLWSIWNFAGRFGSGYMSDVLMNKKGIERPVLMTVSLAVMSTGHVIIGSGVPGNLYMGSVIVGLCYGSQWSLMPTIASEVFGVQHFGTIFNTISIASPLGSYVLSVRVIGYLYDREAEGRGSYCRGVHCFMVSFFVLGCVSILGAFVALVLFFRTRGIYANIMRARRRMFDSVDLDDE